MKPLCIPQSSQALLLHLNVQAIEDDDKIVLALYLFSRRSLLLSATARTPDTVADLSHSSIIALLGSHVGWSSQRVDFLHRAKEIVLVLSTFKIFDGVRFFAATV